jgi:xylulokinase
MCVSTAFSPYDTFYPQPGWHEQCPYDWWNAVKLSTAKLLETANVEPQQIRACGISGHSLGTVPLNHDGEVLRERTPIWSDGRAELESREYFERIPQSEWYRITGNGFPPPLYTVFKVMWYRRNEPELFARTAKIVGTKDYINYLLTGRLVTDHSYASGSGVYDLANWEYSTKLIEASGLSPELFPEARASTEVVGSLRPEAAAQLGLPRDVKVVNCGVDNSCMALGARNIKEGRVYNSIGSSSWIAVCSSEPLIDLDARPFVFAHVLPGFYTSACSIFAAGSSFRWVRDVLCADLVERASRTGEDPYALMTALAEQAPAGSNGLLFNPSLAGGTSLDPSPRIRGAFAGLDLAHGRAELIRAAMEGIAMGLRVAADALRDLAPLEEEMLVVGGGSNSALWRQIFADVYGMRILKTGIDQDAAALGAAALAAVGTGLWNDFERIDELHEAESVKEPQGENQALYENLLPAFNALTRSQAELADMLSEISK